MSKRLLKIRFWLIQKLAGNCTIVINADIDLDDGFVLRPSQDHPCLIANCSVQASQFKPCFSVTASKEAH